MRALVVAAWPPWPLTDGARLVLHHQLEHLAHRHDITVLAARRDGPGAGPPLAPAGVDLRLVGRGGRSVTAYARSRLRSAATGEPAAVHRVQSPTLLAAVDAELRDARPEVVHLFGWGTASLAGRGGRRPVHTAIDAWELGARNQPVPWWRAAFEGGQRAKVARHERRHYPRCAAVVVVAEPDAEHLRARVPAARVEVVPNGVEPGPEPGPVPDSDLLGFHGALATEANAAAAAVLVEHVLPRVRRHRPEAGVLLIGRDPAPAVRRLPGPGVSVTGAVADVRPWLERLAVYVAPLVSGTGLKNKVLEAMVAGRPVVATPVAVAGIGAGPGIVVADDPPAVAEAVVALLEDRERCRRIGAAGRRRAVEEFSWDRSARQVERLWVEAAG